MKKFSVLMLSAMLVLSLAACSGKKETTETEETKVEENAASSASSVVDADEGDGLVRPENYGTVQLHAMWNIVISPNHLLILHL